jgi:hypothetical protein
MITEVDAEMNKNDVLFSFRELLCIVGAKNDFTHTKHSTTTTRYAQRAISPSLTT